MTSNRNFKAPLKQQNSLESYMLDGTQRKKNILWRQRSFNNFVKNLNTEETKGRALSWTLSQTCSQPTRTHSVSLVDYTDPKRTMVILEKQDNEAFGFEVQTYGLKVKNSSTMEMCTFVCSVQDGSAAEAAGLTAGLVFPGIKPTNAMLYQLSYRNTCDIILSVDGVSIEGSTHQHIITLIRFSTNKLKLETVSGNVVKRIELEKKLCYLKQTLREKWVELQSLTLQEKQLTQGNLNEGAQHPTVDSLMSVFFHSNQRISSDSSCRSIMTDDSEDGAFMSSVFDDSIPFSPSESNGSFFQMNGGPSCSLTRTRSISLTSSNSSLSPSWENSASSMFGTMPQKSSRSSFRKHILKFIPGLNHSVEEEENS